MSVFGVVFVLILIFGGTALIGAPYVPSRRREVEQAFKRLYKIKPNDLLVDLGSGDGSVLRQASKLGARSVGFEINPILVVISWLLSWRNDRILIKMADLWHARLPKETTIVYVFFVDRDMPKLKIWLQDQVNTIGHSVFVMSLAFDLDDKKPIKKDGVYFLYEFNPLQRKKAQV